MADLLQSRTRAELVRRIHGLESQLSAAQAALDQAERRIVNQRSELADLNREHHRGNEFWRKAARANELRAEPLAEFARFVVTLDDPNAVELRRSITLTEIIERARAAIVGALLAGSTP